MGTPQILVICLSVLNLFFYAVLDGKPKEGEWRFSHGLFNTGLTIGLLWWGGFFA